MKHTRLFILILMLYYPKFANGETVEDYNQSEEEFNDEIWECNPSFNAEEFFWMFDNKMVTTSEEYSDLRLPGSILPRLYEISLLPHLVKGNFTTEGSVDIFVECVDDTNNITLHIDSQNIFYQSSLIKVMYFSFIR